MGDKRKDPRGKDSKRKPSLAQAPAQEGLAGGPMLRAHIAPDRWVRRAIAWDQKGRLLTNGGDVDAELYQELREDPVGRLLPRMNMLEHGSGVLLPNGMCVRIDEREKAAMDKGGVEATKRMADVMLALVR